MWGSLAEKMGCERSTSMEMKDHYDTLAGFDIFNPLQVLPINDQGSFHLGDGPVPGNLLSISVDKTDGFHFNTHINTSFFSGFLS
jgi:hypothetical protein